MAAQLDIATVIEIERRLDPHPFSHAPQNFAEEFLPAVELLLGAFVK
jgi:hypothetical protein